MLIVEKSEKTDTELRVANGHLLRMESHPACTESKSYASFYPYSLSRYYYSTMKIQWAP
jgi:hypothetical protein